MMRALFSAATGMIAQQMNVDVISNNLANVNTTGFKKSRVDFQDLLYQNIRSAGTAEVRGAQIPTGIQVGMGVRPVAVEKIFSQGDFQQTGNPMDLVIEGDGFFQILQPDGSTAYTRDGAFKLDSTGKFVTANGFAVQPAITIPPEATAISVGADGTVSVTLPGQTAPQEVGQLQLARFVNPAGMVSIGHNLFRPTAASGDPVVGIPGLAGVGTIAQGFLEISNVKVVEELVNLIVAQRAYEVNSKAIQTADQMLANANNLRQ